MSSDQRPPLPPGPMRWQTIAVAALACAAWLSPVAAEKTAADYFIHHLPGAPEPLLKMHAGHIEIIPEHHGNIFFWQFQNTHIAEKQRTVLWLNGGPGCSSMDGALMEIGPYRVAPDGHLVYNNGSWTEFANVIFVDQPVGTGFSYVDTDSYDHELNDMANHMVTFLDKYFALFPEYSHDDLYIAGESYAGQYIPYVARAILDRNAASQNPWSLAGLLIGNGWISSAEQYLSYLPFAYKMGLIEGGSADATKIESQQALCVKDLDASGKDSVDVPSCEMILQELLRVSRNSPKYHGRCLNMYDVRLEDDYPSCGMAWPQDLVQVTPYLRRKEVTMALHIDADKKTGWTECNNQVGNAFSARNSRPSKELLPGLLEQVPIILFSGDQDLICNHMGTEELINKLTWNGATGMETSPGVWAPRRDWTFDGEPAGIWQSARNLTYIKFYNSSHMVPFDYPKRTRDMLDRFMGVDTASYGGDRPASMIDGDKVVEDQPEPVASVPAPSPDNSTAIEEAEKEALQEATWRAYYKSGEVALVVVVIAVSVWIFFLVRARRRRAGYRGVLGSDPNDGPGGLGLNGFTMNGFAKNNRHRDVEAADFDEAELDDLARQDDMDGERFDVGDDSDDGEVARQPNGHR